MRFRSAIGAASGMLVLLGAAVPLLAAPQALGATTAVVVMTPKGATTVPQGVPFRLHAAINNSASQAAHIDVTFSVQSSAGEAVAFNRWDGAIPANGTQNLDLSFVASQWFADTGPFSVIAESGGQAVGEPLAFTVARPQTRAPIFKDVTSAAGLGDVTLPKHSCEQEVAGAAWGDVDGDGNLDLYVPSRTGPSHLFINDGHGHFTDEAAARGVDNAGALAAGAVFADYDNDGDPDLYVIDDGANRLYRNDGTGHFVDVAGAAGVDDQNNSSSASWADYDNDGNLDLYVTNYADCAGGLEPVTYQYDRLYHNNGDGTFTDTTSLLDKDPTTATDGSTLGAGYVGAWFDYNNDGLQDLYLGNDYYGKNPDKNHLWRNGGGSSNGSWSFQDVSVSSDTGYSMNSMGVAVNDYNRDGFLDLALSNIAANRLLKNDHDGTFTDVAAQAGVERQDQKIGQRSITWGVGSADFNLDGWEDLYFPAGSLNPIEPQPNELFVNNSRGGFLDLSAPSKADDPGVSRGVAFADYNHDGRMDMYVLDLSGTPHLFENVTSKRDVHWLEIDTVGTHSNRDGCGARINATIGGRPMTREVICGSESLGSGNDPTVHLGLGSASSIARVTIRWPSGKRQVLKNVKVDRRITVREPK